MKQSILHKTALFCVGAMVALGAVSARADGPKKTDDAKHTTKTSHASHHKKHQETRTASRVEAEHPADAHIPTRDGRHGSYAPGRELGGSDGTEHAVLTGSQIPRTYQRRGYTTDAAEEHTVIDQNDIRLQTADKPSDALRRLDPSITFRGPR